MNTAPTGARGAAGGWTDLEVALHTQHQYFHPLVSQASISRCEGTAAELLHSTSTIAQLVQQV